MPIPTPPSGQAQAPAMTREELLHLYPAHRSRLIATLSRLVGPAEAEDLVQETLLRALSAVADFRGEAALGTWLHRIGVNLAYDRLRRRARDTDQAPTAEEAVAPVQPDPMEGTQMSRCVQQLLATLPATQRQVLIQADMLEHTTTEIARDAGITVGNAKIRLHRARRAMKTALEAHCDFHHREAGVLCCLPKPSRN
jgi:RNA polymerase sigma-70 factor (ECF subfamily)